MRNPYKVVVLDGWFDVTESDDDPWTLAKEDGVGALQFSGAVYRFGEKPDPSPKELFEILCAHMAQHGLSTPEDVVLEFEPVKLAAASFKSEGTFFRAWYVSDGFSITCITYNCADGCESFELQESEKIVRSLRVSYEYRT